MRLARVDRELDPEDPMQGATPGERWQYVLDMLVRLTGDVTDAWAEFATGPAFRGRRAHSKSLTYRNIELAWRSLSERSLRAFADGLTWPPALELLTFDDGPAQYVRRIAWDERP